MVRLKLHFFIFKYKKLNFLIKRCGNYRNLKPEYEKAAEILLEDDPPIAFAKVNCEGGGEESCSKYEIIGYPTMKIFKNGLYSSEYYGPRDADGIVDYMRKQVGLTDTDLQEYDESSGSDGIVAYTSEQYGREYDESRYNYVEYTSTPSQEYDEISYAEGIIEYTSEQVETTEISNSVHRLQQNINILFMLCLTFYISFSFF